MYPYLKDRVVLVDGPAATGVYDLNFGLFYRINKQAGELLKRLSGISNSFSLTEQEFIDECVSKGLVELQACASAKQATQLRDVIRKIRPVKFAWIELISKCNQYCKHFFLGSDLNSFSHYTKYEVFEMLKTLNEVGTRQIVFSGGEPLSHPDFEEILDHAGTNYLFKLSLLTNGSHH